MKTSSRFFAAAAALLGWFAIIAQAVLMFQNRQASVAETIVRFFSFFTLLTNITAAAAFTVYVFKPAQTSLTRPGAMTAITVYMLVVGLVYNTVLRFIWEPAGLQMLVDELLHVVLPLLFLLFWIVYVPKEKFAYSALWGWLLYPFFYLLFILVRGSFSAFYPYPFVNAAQFGYGQVALNCFFVLLLFIILMVIMISVSRGLASKSARNLSRA